MENEGDSNWNYYYDKKYSGVYSIAKPTSGAKNSTFGNASYFHNYVKKYNHYDKLTDYGKKLYHNYKEFMQPNENIMYI